MLNDFGNSSDRSGDLLNMVWPHRRTRRDIQHDSISGGLDRTLGHGQNVNSKLKLFTASPGGSVWEVGRTCKKAAMNHAEVINPR